MSITKLVEEFEAFNAESLKKSSDALVRHFENKGTLFVTIAGALSSGGIGKSLSPLIKKGFVQGVSCTGANLEEDLLRAYCGKHEKVDWRNLKKEDEDEIVSRGKLRVTDLLFDSEALTSLAKYFANEVINASKAGESLFPHEYCYRVMTTLKEEGSLSERSLEESWLYQAMRKNIPVYVPGWEDSTFANYIIANSFKGEKIDYSSIKNGLSYMHHLVGSYSSMVSSGPTGFLQLGGGIAGDFPICVVPLLGVIRKKPAKVWSYFCQISESHTSYGGYSGAPPNEKITWRKINKESEAFVIESDASIVAPLMFQYVMEKLEH